MSQKNKVSFRLWESLSPFVVSVCLLAVSTIFIGNDAGKGYYQLALLGGAGVAVLIGWQKGVPMRLIWQAVVSNIKPLFPTICFLVCIGMISVTWLLGGVIPSAVFYGIDYLHPKVFLPSVAFFSGVMALACGSSWLTIATMGLAFLKMGSVLGFSAPWVAGAVISGAYFGDKLTPLSETTVLASTMTKTRLVRHVRYMLWTSVPAFLIALLLFFGLGFMRVSDSGQNLLKEEALYSLENRFHIRAAFLLVPLVVVGFTMFGFSPLSILALGGLLGAGIALVDQRMLLDEEIDPEALLGMKDRFLFVAKKIFWGVDVDLKGPREVIKTLSGGGIWGMWPTITIILASVVLSGAMEGVGLLDSLMSYVSGLSSRSKLVGVTLLTAIFFNITVADQYLAIILSSKLFAPLFARLGLASENVSRTVEDSATVTSPLIPWNTCGVAQSSVLGVATLAYLPFCFFNLLSPLISFLISVVGVKIAENSSQKVLREGSIDLS